MRLNEHGNTSRDYNRARDLRNNASPIEKKLWMVLREAASARKLKFRRQQAIHPFIADFACMKARLLDDFDGYSHDTSQEYDKARDEDLKQRGFFILRFSNEDVIRNVEGVVTVIVEQAERLIKNGDGVSCGDSPLPNPPHEGEGTAAFLVEREGQNVRNS